MPIAGLHSCQPGNEPQVGQQKLFTVIQVPPTDTKRAWTKIKNASADQGGTLYRIVKANLTGFTDPHGNISFNLEIEPQNGLSEYATTKRSGPVNVGGVMSKDDYFTRKEMYDREREARWVANQPRIERQHSQHMTVILLQSKFPDGIPESFDINSWLRDVTDYFQRDIGRSPIKTEPVVQPEPEQISGDMVISDEPDF